VWLLLCGGEGGYVTGEVGLRSWLLEKSVATSHTPWITHLHTQAHTSPGPFDWCNLIWHHHWSNVSNVKVMKSSYWFLVWWRRKMIQQISVKTCMCLLSCSVEINTHTHTHTHTHTYQVRTGPCQDTRKVTFLHFNVSLEVEFWRYSPLYPRFCVFCSFFC